VMAAGERAAGERAAGERAAGEGKPTLAQLGVDLAELHWQRSGPGAGSLEVAFIGAEGDPNDAPTGAGARWVLLRVAEDPDGRVLVYNRTEWKCFLDGVSRGEFG